MNKTTSLIRKPGYLRVFGINPQKQEYIPYEQLYLYPSLRRKLIYQGFQNGLSCACLPYNDVMIVLGDDLSFKVPPTGHDYFCTCYRHQIQRFIQNSQLLAVADKAPMIKTDARWGKRARNKNHLYSFDSFGTTLRSSYISFIDLVGAAAVLSYNKRMARLKETWRAPTAEEIVSDLLLEMSGITLINNAKVPQTINLGAALYNPWDKEAYHVSFVVGRLARSAVAGKVGKTTTLYIETLNNDFTLETTFPTKVSVDTLEWTSLMNQSDPLTPRDYSDHYVAALVINKEVRLPGQGSYDSLTHSFYGSEGSSFLIRKAQLLAVMQLSKYGMPCRSTTREKEISEAYMDLHLICSKRLLPLPGCPEDLLPAFVIENDAGPSRVLFYRSDTAGFTPDLSLYSVSFID